MGRARSSRIEVAGRLRVRKWPILVALTLIAVGQRGLTAGTAVADPAQIGAWTAPFNINQKGIHSQVLPNGKVLLFSYPQTTAGTSAIVWDPATGLSTDVSMSYSRDAFCSGEDLLPDGRVFVTGGHLIGVNPAKHEDAAGVDNTDVFDPATRTWTPSPSLSEARWYPSNIELNDGRILIFSGQADKTTKSPDVDLYDPSANTLSRLPSTASKTLPLYPRLLLLPTGEILLAGPAKGMQQFNPSTNSWSWVGNLLFGARNNGNAVLLPGLNKVLVAGGTNSTSGVTATAEIIDVSGKKPTWRYTAPMTYARAYSNAVLLADGTVLEVGGGTGGAYLNPVYSAELFDPTTETWSTMAAQTAPRIYHSTAVLLPNGQVLSAGMDSGSYQYTAELYSPPYLFRGPRPTIDAAPSSVGYGETFTIATPDGADVNRAALVKPGGTTHAISMDQRYVDLTFTTSDTGLTATAPPDGNHAPPGWYMLFIVNSSGVPSVASWVHVG